MRIRSFFRYLSVFLAAMVLCACPAVDPAGPDRPDNPDNPDVPPSPSRDYFRLMINLATPVPDDYEIVFNCDATGTTLIVQTDQKEWSASASESWCDTHKDENGNLVILVPSYGEYHEMLAPRSCKVRVKAGTIYDKTITVAQQSWTAFFFADDLAWDLSLFSNVLKMPPSGGSSNVTIVTNSWKWRAQSDVAWIQTKYVDPGTLKVTTSARPEGEAARKGKVTLTNISDDFVTASFMVVDSDAVLHGEDYEYGDQSDWD